MALEMAALGRPFALGMLYDCRSDKLLPGITLWKAEALERVFTRPQENTAFEVLTSDSLSDKWMAMNVSGSLKVSFLFGLVDAGGSAKYLMDTKEHRQSTRVTLKYTRSTKFEQLSMNHLSYDSLSFPGVMEKCAATHVVTGIQYGAQAFFIFDQDGAQSQSSRDLQCAINLKVLVKKLPLASAELPMTSREKEEVNKFRCTFYGDFALEKNPETFQEAIKLYSSLPKLLGAKGEKAIPVKVWLHPLSDLDDRAARLVREISDALVFRAENLIQQMSEAMMQCNELIGHPTAETFPGLQEKLQRFKELCCRFTHNFQKQLSQELPSVRSGKIPESNLENILSRTEQTPFGIQRVREFLNRQQQEMDAAQSYLKVLPEVRVVPTRSQLQKAILDQDFKYMLCFNLAWLDGLDSSLIDMEAWLSNGQVGPVTTGTQIAQWLEEDGRAKRARQLLKSFKTFFRANCDSKKTQFLVSSVNLKNPQISILLYEDGDLVATDWTPPCQPQFPCIRRRGHNTMELLLQPSEYARESLEGYLVEYKPLTAATWTSIDRTYQGEEVEVLGLEPNSWYHFRYSAVYKAGFSPASEISNPEKTLCTSPPGAPQVTAAPNVLYVSWQAPRIMAEGVTISSFRVEYREQDTSTWLQTGTSDTDPRCVIRGLQTTTTYTIRVFALCEGEESLASEETKASTMAEKLTDNIPLHEEEMHRGSRYQLDDVCWKSPTATNKVILLVGDTGSGKSALLNGLANYVQGVTWEDDFRLEVTQGDTDSSGQRLVREYILQHRPGSPVPYTLTVLDAPPFGDPQKSEHDKEVIRAIQDFFTTVQPSFTIDAICLVVRSSSTYLTYSQIYVFKSLCSLFAKDVKENLKILITSCDAERPPVLDALKATSLPCPMDSQGDLIHYKFNMSALSVTNNDQFHRLLWAAGEEAMRKFCASLNSMESGCLQRTLNVMEDHENLEDCVQALQEQISDKHVTMQDIKKLQGMLESTSRLMEDNQDHEEEDSQEPPDGAIVTCAECSFICHYPCNCVTGKNTLQQCSAMNWRGQCQACPGRCMWRLHFLQEAKLDEDIGWTKKRAHETSAKEVIDLTMKIQGLQETLSAISQQEQELLVECRRTFQRLSNSALCVHPLFSTEAIQQMMHAELTLPGELCGQRTEVLTQAQTLAQMLEGQGSID